MLSTNGQLERLSWKSIYLRAVHAGFTGEPDR